MQNCDVLFKGQGVAQRIVWMRIAHVCASRVISWSCYANMSDAHFIFLSPLSGHGLIPASAVSQEMSVSKQEAFAGSDRINNANTPTHLRTDVLRVPSHVGPYVGEILCMDMAIPSFMSFTVETCYPTMMHAPLKQTHGTTGKKKTSGFCALLKSLCLSFLKLQQYAEVTTDFCLYLCR